MPYHILDSLLESIKESIDSPGHYVVVYVGGTESDNYEACLDYHNHQLLTDAYVEYDSACASILNTDPVFVITGFEVKQMEIYDMTNNETVTNCKKYGAN